MKILILVGITLTLVFFAIAAKPVDAHHQKPVCPVGSSPVTVSGTITKAEWQNPHVHYYIDVKDEKTGKVTNMVLEVGPPHVLVAENPPLTRVALAVGNKLTAYGVFSVSGTQMRPCGSVSFSDLRYTFSP